MTIAIPQALPTFIELGKAQTLTLPAYSVAGAAALLIPSAPGTWELLASDGTVVVASKANAIVDGVLTVSLTSSEATLDSDDRYQEIWTGEFGGIVEVFRREAIVAKYVPRQVITDQDLWGLLPDLRDCLPGRQTSWEPQRTEAWNQLSARLIAKGNRPNLIVSSWAVRNLHLYWTLFLVAELMISDGNGGRWPLHLERFEARTKAEWDTLSFEYDAGDDGTVDARKAANPVVVLGALPGSWGPASSGRWGW